MDNAERIYQELLRERASLWFISDSYGFKMMIKAPSTAIRALIGRCRIVFLFGKDNETFIPVFHTGVRIYDDPKHYLAIHGTHRFIEDHYAVKRIMTSNTVFVHLHNELTVCMAIAEVSFTNSEKNKFLLY